jgi:outer membrane PBP1 activator LpoA protein
VRSAALLLPAAVTAVLLAGCGGSTSDTGVSDFSGDQKSVAQVVVDLAKAGKKADAKEICNTIFAPATAAKLVRGSDDCVDVVKDQLKDASDFDVTVKKVTINGSTAVATVQSTVNGNDALQTLNLVKSGNAWRIASLAS